jgi:predicted peptidase
MNWVKRHGARIDARAARDAQRTAPLDRACCAALQSPMLECRPGCGGWQHGIYGEPGGARLLRFRLKSPRGKGPFPLLIFLHGAGRNGYDGKHALAHGFIVRLHLALFCRQRLHVLVPQLGWQENYGSDEFSNALGGAIDRLGRVDRSRLYIIGISMGGCGAFSECKRHPGRYAAAIPAVGWTGPEEMDALAQTPLWLAHSPEEDRCYARIHEALRARGAQVRYTRKTAFGHKMTGPFFLFQPWAKWLLSYSKQN